MTERDRPEERVAGPDPLLDALGALPERDVSDDRAEAIWRDASAAFAGAGSSFWRRLGATYRLVLEPALALAVCVLYLGWAVGQVQALYDRPEGPAAAGVGEPAAADRGVALRPHTPSDLPG